MALVGARGDLPFRYRLREGPTGRSRSTGGAGLGAVHRPRTRGTFPVLLQPPSVRPHGAEPSQAESADHPPQPDLRHHGRRDDPLDGLPSAGTRRATGTSSQLNSVEPRRLPASGARSRRPVWRRNRTPAPANPRRCASAGPGTHSMSRRKALPRQSVESTRGTHAWASWYSSPRACV